jgi:integrase/recombinase XerD
MSELRRTATDYLAIRRALGFKLREHDRLLEEFLTYLDASGATTITVTDVVAWATLPGVSPAVSSKRFSVVRAFARHMRCLDPATEIPPADLVARPPQRRRGYLYSQADIDRLIAAARGMRPALRAATYQTYFGLLAATGMRKGEAIGLDRGDVDLHAGVIAIRETKFHKHRRLPLHPSTIRALRSYSEARDQLCPKPKVPPSSFQSAVPDWPRRRLIGRSTRCCRQPNWVSSPGRATTPRSTVFATTSRWPPFGTGIAKAVISSASWRCFRPISAMPMPPAERKTVLDCCAGAIRAC